MKKHVSTFILIVVFLVGLSVLLYPSVSDFWNSRTQSRAVASYDAAVADMDEKDYTDLFAAADAYNAALAENPAAFYDPELLESLNLDIENYFDILDITGTGVMGYITIEKIDVELPIYHGTDEGVLQIAAGHLEGTSFPVGGKSTHCVISAHRGLPTATLFTHLDQLEEGDTFTVTVLDRVLTYKVDLISIVLPDEVEGIQIEDGKDYCTLMTCTPYGINSHRLLVRGHRVATEDVKREVRVVSDAYQIDPVIIAPIMAAPLLFLLLLWLLFGTGKKKKKKKQSKGERVNAAVRELTGGTGKGA